MLIYFIPLIALFLCSFSKFKKRQLSGMMLLIIIFLCLGYMTGSDWREYETYYEDGFKSRLVEPGYMLLSNFFSSIGVGFLTFHMVFKCLSCAMILALIIKLEKGREIYFGIMLWYASFGLFMFINCPFRNTLAVAVALFGFALYMRCNRIWVFLLVVILSMTFHLSSVVLLIAPFIRLEKVKSSVLVGVYMLIMAILLVGGGDLVNKVLDACLPHVLYSRIEYYVDDADGTVLSMGIVPRIVCLVLLIRYRKKILAHNNYGLLVFNMAYYYLILSLVYYCFPMLFRSSLFLAPFYVIAIVYGIKETALKIRPFYKVAFLGIAMAITFTTVRSVYYIPYTNIITNCLSGRFYDFSYRSNYNFINSPYKDK